MVDLHCGDCIDWLNSLADDSIDLLFGSPPYEDARSYGIRFAKKGEAWVQWMVKVVTAASPKVKGLMAFVCEGKTCRFNYSGVPQLLFADLKRAGYCMRKPPIYRRSGIPGSGGPDWLRNDYEPIICITRPGKLPWSNNTACGHTPKFPPGGNPSHHSRDGRVNRPRPQREGDHRRVRTYTPPVLSNPGNVIPCSVGKGHMGSDLAHQNEAPFPLKLAEFFVRSFCRPGGVVADPFLGSGTTAHAAILHGRRFAGCDIRQSQIDITRVRLAGIPTHSLERS